MIIIKGIEIKIVQFHIKQLLLKIRINEFLVKIKENQASNISIYLRDIHSVTLPSPTLDIQSVSVHANNSKFPEESTIQH